MSVVSQRPRRQYEVLHWGHVDLQEYANGRFVSNNNIFIIVFFNTYYHKQINKILISACNETFRQSSDPVYAHTPMRNVGRLRTFNPKLKDSAGGEVNKLVDCSDVVGASPGASPVRVAPTTSSFWTCGLASMVRPETPDFNRLSRDNCKTRRETFKCWDLVWLIPEVWW